MMMEQAGAYIFYCTRCVLQGCAYVPDETVSRLCVVSLDISVIACNRPGSDPVTLYFTFLIVLLSERSM